MLPAARDPRLAARARSSPTTSARRGRSRRWRAAVGAGERTLSRLFRDEFGMTYPQWRTRLRVFEAMILLAGGTLGHRDRPPLRLGDDEQLHRHLPPHDGPHAGRLPAQSSGSLGLTASSESWPLNTRMKPPPRAVATRLVLPPESTSTYGSPGRVRPKMIVRG